MTKGDVPARVEITHDEWTLETLKIYLESVIANLKEALEERAEAQEKAINAALISAEKAVDKAEHAAERRFETISVWRSEQVGREQAFMSREEYTAGHQRLQEQVNRIIDSQAVFVSRSENNEMHARIDAQLDELKDRMNRTEGRGAGLNQAWLILVALISMIGVIVGIFVYVAEHG